MSADLPDKRLNERSVIVLNELAGQPAASIPAACGGHSEMTAAYRFFDNKKVGFENVLQLHIDATFKRMAEHPVVVVAQDTTEIELTRPKQQVDGTGPLDGDKRRGCLLHPLTGFTPDGMALGTVYAEAWVRADDAPTPKSDREKTRKHTPIEDKESIRRVDGYRQSCELATQLPETQVVSVADSEADIYELMQEAQEGSQNADWIIRACQDRTLRAETKQEET